MDPSDNSAQCERGRPMSDIFLIVNETAGSGRCKQMFQKVEVILKNKGVDYCAKFTKYPLHAVEIAREALKNNEKYIVAVGGDGTVNEVSSVLCGVEGVKMGILPFGTGNDIAGALDLPQDEEKAVEVLVRGKTYDLDMGIANDEHKFINVGGQGFDVDVLVNTDRFKKGRSGMAPYIMGLIKTIVHRKKIHARISSKEFSTEMDVLLIVVGNGTRFGGGMLATPNALTDDGKFDVCVVEYIGFFHMLALLPLFLKGKHVDKKPVHYFKTEQIRIETDGQYKIELDGEVMNGTPVEYRILPGAIKIVRK